jgi:hypothetical protein
MNYLLEVIVEYVGTEVIHEYRYLICLTHVHHIREVLGSNLGLETSYPD